MAPAARALLVEVGGSNEKYLVHNGFRHRIRAADVPATALALRSPPTIRVSPAVVDVLPVGTPLAPITLPDVGSPSTAVPGQDVLIGQLLTARTANARPSYYLAEATRLRQITELQYDIQRAHPPTAAAYSGGQPLGIPLGLVAASRAPQAEAPAHGPGDAPEISPEFAGSAGAALCLTFSGDSPTPRLTLDASVPAGDPLSATPGRTDGGVALADRVVVPAGKVAVVEVVQGHGTQAGTLCVVTDQGRAHPVLDGKVLETLGYGGVRPSRVPAGLVAKVPLGPGLSHEAALKH